MTNRQIDYNSEARRALADSVATGRAVLAEIEQGKRDAKTGMKVAT